MHGTKFLLLFAAISSGALAQFLAYTARDNDNYYHMSLNADLFLSEAKGIKGFRKNMKKYPEEYNRAFVTGTRQLITYLDAYGWTWGNGDAQIGGDGPIGYVDRREKATYKAGLKINNENNVFVSHGDVQPILSDSDRVKSLAEKFAKKEYIIFFGDKDRGPVLELARKYMEYINKRPKTFFQTIVFMEDDFVGVMQDRERIAEFPEQYFKE